MKKLIKIFIFIVCMNVTHLAFAGDWVYLGRYVQYKNVIQNHHVDVFLVNHLVPYVTPPVVGGNYHLYDVYYMHDHSTDKGTGTADWDDRSFNFQAMIVPLNIYGKTMGSGTYGGTVTSEFTISPKGVFGITPKHHGVYDIVTQKLLFEATGNMGSEVLYKDTAAELILKKSGNHPVSHGDSDGLNGSEYYPYR